MEDRLKRVRLEEIIRKECDWRRSSGRSVIRGNHSKGVQLEEVIQNECDQRKSSERSAIEGGRLEGV